MSTYEVCHLCIMTRQYVSGRFLETTDRLLLEIEQLYSDQIQLQRLGLDSQKPFKPKPLSLGR